MATLEKSTGLHDLLLPEAHPRSVPDNLAWAALTRHAHRRWQLALIWETRTGSVRTSTFFELERASNRVANALAQLGVGRGDRVFTLLGRTPALYTSLLGALKLGAVVGVLFSDFGPTAIQQRLADAGAKVLFAEATSAAKLLDARAGLPDLEHVIFVGEEASRAARELRAACDLGAWVLDELLAKQPPCFSPVPVARSEACFFVYTSGTTGPPKGVVHCHAIADQLAATAREVLALDESDLYWCTADPGWVTGLCYGIFAPWLLGCPIFVYEGEFAAERWLELLERHQITCWYTTPTTLRRLMNWAGRRSFAERRDFALRRIYTVGEPLGPEVIAWAEEAFGAPVYDNYWQTETGAQVIANRPGLLVKRGSMGKAVAGAHVAVIDEQGNELPPNVVGDIAVRPTLSSLFKGYWHLPEATRACFRAGWYVTRDKGRRDEDGYFWFAARADDVITCEAQKIGPCEVENALATHPAVAEAAVVGVPDPVTTERVKAFVVLRPDRQPTRELAVELAEHVEAQLSAVARPREVEFCAHLPRTNSGKVQRAKLRSATELQGDCFVLQ